MKQLKQLFQQLNSIKSKPIIVGGLVRDGFLNKESKDMDVEVHNISLDTLENILSKYGKVDSVGKSFGVLKMTLDTLDLDFSIPRVETKVGNKHTDFKVSFDNISEKEAFKRRDFTINAIGRDAITNEIIDHFNGVNDLKNSTLRHVDRNTFIEDPLRVFRAIQFIARFNLTVADETKTLIKDMVSKGMLNDLPRERVLEEFKKLLLKSDKPSLGLMAMVELNVIDYFPELKSILSVPQSPIWHPEGDVWTHTLMVVDEMAKHKTGDDNYDFKMMLSALCHDLGKATHTQIGDKITAHGHEKAGVEPTKSFLKKLINSPKLIDEIANLVELHLMPSQLFRSKAKNASVRRLSLRANITDLVLLARVDFLCRTTSESLSGVYEAGDWLLSKAKELEVDKKPLKPLVQGRDLIELGFKPSKEFKEILDKAFESQLLGNDKETIIKEIKNG